jgi:predicted Zn-dependent protease
MRRPSAPWVPLILAFAAACSEASAPRVEPPAYDPTQLTGGLLYRWPTGATIAVYVDPTAVPTGVELATATLAGMQAWKAALGGSQFAFRTATSPADADVIVHVSAAPRLVALAGCAPPPDLAGGVTFLCPARDSALTLPLLAGPGAGRVKIDIAINPAATSATHSLLALVTHELGHAIGIGGHSSDPADVMHAQPTVTTPSQRDIATLRWVVRQPADLRL